MPAAASAKGLAFADSNVLLYLQSNDSRKAGIAERLVEQRLTLSVQVLNEIANVARRKFAMSWLEVVDVLGGLRDCSDVLPLTVQVHERALTLVQRHSFAWYDSLIVASALEAGCTTLFSEDMQNGLIVDRTLKVCNPFLAP